MNSEAAMLPHAVEGTSRGGTLEHSLERRLLEVLRTFRGVSEGSAEVLVFTDRTPGHAWEILMKKLAEADGTLSFRFSASHLPAPCSPYCEPDPIHVAESDWLNEVFVSLLDHIACVTCEEERSPCCLV